MKRGISVLLMVLVLMFAVLFGCGKSDRDDLVRGDAAHPTVNKAETNQDIMVSPEDAFPPVIITDPVESNCKLIVDGKEIPDSYVYIREDGRTAMVPILTVLESLGIEMTWENENDVHIEHDGKVYIFELDRGVLYEKDERICLFMAPPGEDRYRMYYELVNGEYLVDDLSLTYFTHELDINIWVYADEPAVYVVKSEDAARFVEQYVNFPHSEFRDQFLGLS